MSVNCKICSQSSIPFAKALLLGKYEVQYFRCSRCGFIQTEDPYWISEAYSDPVALNDIGLVHRNIRLSAVTKAMIFLFFQKRGKFIDYGGGYGLFVRLMRDGGFDFYWTDDYCPNLFAQGFTISDLALGQFELLTAFEVFEHFIDPLAQIKQLMGFSRNILFSTVFIPSPTPFPDDWWYYAVEHGQHVSLFSRDSLQYIAQELNLNYYTNGKSLHSLTEKKLASPLFRLISNPRVAVLISSFVRQPSLLKHDYFKLTGKKLK